MKKILFILMFVASSSQAFFIDKSTIEYVKNHTDAFENLKPHVKDITVLSFTHYDHYNHSCYTTYNYLCSGKAKQALNHYQEAQKILTNKIMGTSIGDGVMLGALVALCNKMMGGQTLNKKVLIPLIGGAIALILYQNRKLGSVAAFDHELRDSGNQFEHASFYTVGRIICTLLSASISYFGTDYTYSRLAQLYSELSEQKS